MSDTHVVTNQVPPLEDFNPASSPVLTEALIREGGDWGLDEVTELGALSGAGGRNLGRAGRPQPADPAHPRPLRQSCRRGRVRPGLPRADEGGDRSWTACRAVGRRPAGSPRRPRRQDVGVDARTRPRMPDLDDDAVFPRCAQRRAGRGVRPLLTGRAYDPNSACHQSRYTAGMSMTEKQGGSDVRAGTTQATPKADGTKA